jgi:hypothetical protein
VKIKKDAETPLSIKADGRGKMNSAEVSGNVWREKSDTRQNKLTIWIINITIITFVLSAFFSFLSEITTSTAHISVAFMLLLLLIVLSVIFDAIGVAATSCELAPLLSMAAKKIKGSRMAIRLVKNSGKVSSICCDVLGDICGIVSGSCTLAIVIKITLTSADRLSFWISILFSSIVCAVTVGGKAIFKNIAIRHSKDIILLTGRMLSVFEKK